jgi:hypothetical protein
MNHVVDVQHITIMNVIVHSVIIQELLFLYVDVRHGIAMALGQMMHHVHILEKKKQVITHLNHNVEQYIIKKG